jgi:hypothetical protein
MDVDAFAVPPDASSSELVVESIRCRLLDSSDLQAASRCRDVASARALLLARCVLDADAAALPPDVVERIAAALEAADPLAETLLDLHCPACEGEWQIAFDIAAFLQSEVDLQARRLLGEVHVLARGYGWSEADILAMSPRRRRDYLELLLQ